MSRYFIDTEFIEGFHKPLFGKRRHFIDLISIGIVCEDGRTYSAISNEYKYKDADKWVQDNVITPLYISSVHGDRRNHCSSENFQYAYGKSNKQIAKEIVDFVYESEYPQAETNKQKAFVRLGKISPEFYGHNCDYDWVLFCSLFGRMIDLPTGFPMYCRDLKQTLDEKAKERQSTLYASCQFPKIATFNEALKSFNLPKLTNEHNALADAKWNLELYNFLKEL
jgi:hypothetical protein